MSEFNALVVGVTASNNDGSSRQHYIAKYCQYGKTAILKPEPNNPYDSQAVGVWVKRGFLLSDVQIGYLSADRLAGEIFRHFDCGGQATAKIEEVMGDGRQNLGVLLLINKQ